MKLIIAGSRDIPDYDDVWNVLVGRVLGSDVEEIVSGMARGADTIGCDFAEQFHIPLKEFPADWDKYGKAAGYIRNKEMAEYADELLVFWDGKSKGTQHMIDLAKQYKLTTTIVYV